MLLIISNRILAGGSIGQSCHGSVGVFGVLVFLLAMTYWRGPTVFLLDLWWIIIIDYLKSVFNDEDQVHTTTIPLGEAGRALVLLSQG